MVNRMLIALFVTVTLLLPGQGWGAMAVDVRGDSGAVNFGSSTITQSATIAGSSPLAVCVVWQGTETLSSVTWNAGSMGAAVASVTSGAGVNFKVAGFVLANPASGTHDIVATFSATPSGGSELFYVATTDGDTGTPNRTASTRTDIDGTGPGLTLANSQSGDLLIHCVSNFGVGLVFDGSEVSTNTITTNNGSSGSWGLSTLAATGANTVLGSDDHTAYGEIAFALIPAAADNQPMHIRGGTIPGMNTLGIGGPLP